MSASITSRACPLWIVAGVLASLRGIGAETAPGTVVERLSGETRLVIREFRGEIDLRVGEPGEIRYLASTAAGSDASPVVALTREPPVLRLAPREGDGAAIGRLEVAIPPGVSVRVAIAEGKVSAVGLESDLDVDGGRVAVDARGLQGSASVRIEGGSLSFLEGTGDLTADLTDADADIGAIEGRVHLAAEGGRVALRNLRGPLDATTYGTSISVEGGTGPTTLRSRGGDARLGGLSDEATIVLSGTTLLLEKARGDVEVETDSDFEFRDCAASLHVSSLGGAVRGRGNEGILEIRSTGGGEIDLEAVTGPVRIGADGTRVKLREIATELLVYASFCDVAIHGAHGPVVVENDGGPVEISAVPGEVEVTSRDGEVRLLHLAGPVRVEADGPVLEVGWSRLPEEGDSTIRNAGGGARVRFPGAGGCQVEARARFGRVESELPSVAVSGEGAFATGAVGAGGRSTVRIEADGDVFLLGAPGASPQDPARAR